MNAFAAAILLYGLIGYPTPDNFGVSEVLIGACLLASLNWKILISPVGTFLSLPVRGIGVLCFVATGLIIAPVTGLLNGALFLPWIRDLIPFFFWMLPVLVNPVILSHGRKIATMAATAGTLLAIRSLLPPPFDPPAFSYLANDPLVLFGCVYWLLRGLDLWHDRFRGVFKAIGLAAARALMALPCVIAMAMAQQRAAFGWLFFAMIFQLLAQFVRSPRRALVWTAMVAISVTVLWPYIHSLILVLLEKARLVGSNARYEELQAVLDALNISGFYAFFGIGWGGVISSPALGGLDATYTHSFLTYMLLKTGVIGLISTLLYLGSIVLRFRGQLGKDRIMALAIAGPFVIDLLLYASYKSLGFGILLTLMCVELPRLYTAWYHNTIASEFPYLKPKGRAYTPS